MKLTPIIFEEGFYITLYMKTDDSHVTTLVPIYYGPWSTYGKAERWIERRNLPFHSIKYRTIVPRGDANRNNHPTLSNPSSTNNFQSPGSGNGKE